jgi:hypothetical protein
MLDVTTVMVLTGDLVVDPLEESEGADEEAATGIVERGTELAGALFLFADKEAFGGLSSDDLALFSGSFLLAMSGAKDQMEAKIPS